MAAIDDLATSAYTVPLPAPESDGTFTWDHTTVVVAEPRAGVLRGLGFTYASAAAKVVIDEALRAAVTGRDPLDVEGAWQAMVDAVRNIGRPGVASMAIAAVDTALWDLKAKVLGVPLVQLLGRARDAVPVYGSGGFTSFSERELVDQLGGWVDDGIGRVKMKIGTAWGTDERRDVERVRTVRKAVGHDTEVFVDANGAYSVKQARRLAREFEELDVGWFEEPVSSDDIDGLRTVRDGTIIDVAAGEYGYDTWYFERLLRGDAVDVVQADVSRCGGITGWLKVAAVAAAHHRDVSGHCAPSLHVHPACAVRNVRHLEYFADHALVDRALFDGVPTPVHGALSPDESRPGMGLTLRDDVDRYRIC